MKKNILLFVFLISFSLCVKAQYSLQTYLRENPKDKYLFEKIDTSKLCFNHFAYHIVYETVREQILYSYENDDKIRQQIQDGNIIKMEYVTEDNIRYIIASYKRRFRGCGGFPPLQPCICSEYLTPKAMILLQAAMNKQTVIIDGDNTDKVLLHKKMVEFMGANIESGKADISFHLLRDLKISVEYFMSLL